MDVGIDELVGPEPRCPPNLPGLFRSRDFLKGSDSTNLFRVRMLILYRRVRIFGQTPKRPDC